MSGLALFLSMVLSGALGGTPSADDALTLPLSRADRDAILVRSMDATQLHLFFPREDGSFELRLLPRFPSPISRMKLVDFDGDGDQDLATLLQSGEMRLWLGDGRGELMAKMPALLPGHHGHEVVLSALDSGEEAALRELLHRAEPPGELHPIPAALPVGFVPRAVVAGRFSSTTGNDVALIGAGPRPRLFLASADGAVREVTSPLTVHTVFVGDEGFNFSPATVSIQPGDTVHWVWSVGSHNVVSGSGCTADGLFCSPSNTSCAGTPTSGPGTTYDRVFPITGSFPYFCRPHCDFGMTGVVAVGGGPPGILEAIGLQIAKAGTDTQFTYTPACGATSHAIYYADGPIVSGPVWTDSLCVDASGTHVASLPPPVGLQYFVVVGQTAAKEGSYGKNSQNVERGEASQVGACDVPQEIATTCP